MEVSVLKEIQLLEVKIEHSENEILNINLSKDVEVGVTCNIRDFVKF